MNMRTLATGIGVMLTISMVWIGTEFYQSIATPRGLYIDATDARQVEHGRSLYAGHCAACHGALLQGQPNWRERRLDGKLPAPPHDDTGHTWHHPDGELFDITRNGLVPGRTAPLGYETDMPAYAGILSDAEIIAIIAYIKSTWTPDHRALQREVTRNANQGGAR